MNKIKRIYYFNIEEDINKKNHYFIYHMIKAKRFELINIKMTSYTKRILGIIHII